MARDIERVELLFRRQLALQSRKPPRRQAIGRVDGVPSRTGPAAQPAALPRGPRIYRGEIPTIALVPSAGYFNAARVPPDAPVWAFMVGQASRPKLEELIATICNVQSSRRAFRPLFLLEQPEHVELMRQYGFTFEFVSADAYMGKTRQQQIDTFKAKWGVRLCLDVQASGVETMRNARLASGEPDATAEDEGDEPKAARRKA